MAARLIALWLICLPAFAAEAAASDRQQGLERAAALKADAASRRHRADARLEQQEAECARRFRVNDCRDDARAEHLERILEARALDNEAEAIERDIRREDAAARERERLAEMERREADRAERGPRVAAERQRAEEATAKHLADKKIKAAEGARRKAAEAEKLRKRQAEHAERVANKKRQAESRQTESP